MVSLMQRRREMMKIASAPVDNHLKFSVTNQTVSIGDRIATGVYPLASDYNLTILFDLDMTSNPTSGNSRLWKFIRVWDDTSNTEGIKIGKRQASNTQITVWWMSSSYEGINGSSTTAGRYRVAVTHEAGSNTLNVSYKKGNGNRINKSYTGTFYASPTNELFFGQAENNDNSLPPGTLTAKVYDIVLSSAEIDAFFE